MVRKQEQSLAKARLGIKRFSKAPEEAEGEGVRGVSDGLLSVSRRLGVLFSTVPIHPICLCPHIFTSLLSFFAWMSFRLELCPGFRSITLFFTAWSHKAQQRHDIGAPRKVDHKYEKEELHVRDLKLGLQPLARYGKLCTFLTDSVQPRHSKSVFTHQNTTFYMYHRK